MSKYPTIVIICIILSMSKNVLSLRLSFAPYRSISKSRSYHITHSIKIGTVFTEPKDKPFVPPLIGVKTKINTIVSIDGNDIYI